MLITTSGWYTFRHTFRNDGGNLAVDLTILNSTGGTVATWTIWQGFPIGIVGGPAYGWFANQEMADLPIDNSQLSVVAIPLTDFRDVRRSNDINIGPDLGGTGHTSINFTGSTGPAGDTWITVYDPLPNPPPVTFGSVSLWADVLIHTYNNTKGAGPLALFNEATGKKGLALILYDAGNSDSLVLATADQSGGVVLLKSASLGANIAENAWYRVTMDVAVTGANVTVTGMVFRHTTPTDPNSPLGTQIGTTLVFTGARPAGVDATGEVGILASAKSTAVDTSVTNFLINP